ncbi:hypothetical protein V6N13_012438 [Hibiscus sabdariffa]|uniref:Uncharacterized protein n=1 Tax=Hibiscus sabdariffa TaxID=183260 RepID=A0ABR2SFV6_9ROSI
MAMVGGAGLVEAYVMGSLCKEKLEEEQTKKGGTGNNMVSVSDAEKEIPPPAGCFFWVFKRSRSNKVSGSMKKSI